MTYLLDSQQKVWILFKFRFLNKSKLWDFMSHSRAMHWLEAGIDLQYIKDLLGHADLTTTEVYAQINTEMKRKVLESAQPQERPAAEYPSWTEDKSLMGWLESFRDIH